ncbi:hypothetical protein [Pseudonocardia sp. GCM10023141]|uniref:hypothetical protein n=1 Tax=Pseudonocardia sp. GCM10023141 TaxID=3252653 RepID=UPI00361E9970
MATRSDQHNVEEMAAQLADRLISAVAETLAQRSPEPGRERVSATLAIGRAAEPEGDGRTTRLMVTLILIRWLSVARAKLDDEPDRVERALGWVEEALGKRYRARARYTAPVLQSEEGATEILQYRDALGDDFLPSLVWLLAGVVAADAEGDVGWLAALVGVDYDAS